MNTKIALKKQHAHSQPTSNAWVESAAMATAKLAAPAFSAAATVAPDETVPGGDFLRGKWEISSPPWG